MRTALIAGGAGGIGEGIARAFLAAEWQVVVTSRNPSHLQALKDALGNPDRLTTLDGNLVDPDDAADIRDQLIQCFGHLDAMTVSVGGWWQGEELIEVGLDTWESLLRKILTSHFLIAKTFLPALRDHGRNPSATFIGGSASKDPVPNAGPTCIAGAGQIMLVRALAKEWADRPVRINELVLGSVANRRVATPDPTWLTPDGVGSVCLSLAAEDSTVRGQVIHLPDKAAASNLQLGTS